MKWCSNAKKRAATHRTHSSLPRGGGVGWGGVGWGSLRSAWLVVWLRGGFMWFPICAKLPFA